MAKYSKSFLIKFSKKVHIYNSIKYWYKNENRRDNISQKFLRFQMLSELPLAKLKLKVRDSIILLYNFYPTLGECNAT